MPLSYLTLDGKEVSNSARLAAFAAAGLLPSTVEVKTASCGVLQREAKSAVGGLPCVNVGFSDEFSTPQQLGPNSTPWTYTTADAAGVTSLPVPLAGVGSSDGYVVGGTVTASAASGAQPTTGGSWRDGVVVAAFEVMTPNVTIPSQLQVAGRIQGPNGNGSTPGTCVQAVIIWQSATTAQLRLVGLDTSVANNLSTIIAQSATLTVPPGRSWLVLRLAGNVINAEWWTTNPRAGGGQAWQLVTYTITGTAKIGFVTDTLIVGGTGTQAIHVQSGSGDGGNGVAVPTWWARPACAATCHLYPSPFLYPAASLYPDECGGQILSTTPWTDSSRPESADFLGFYIDDIQGMDGSVSRSIDQRMGGLGGAALGQLIQAGRTLQFHGWMFADSCRGLDYGEEWLNDILAQLCTPCPTTIARVRMSVPSPDDGSNDAEGLYYLYEVGLTGELNVTPFGTDCNMAEVTFTLTAGNGWKYQAPQTLLGPVTFASENGSVAATIPAPPAIGINGAIVTIRAGSADLVGLYPALALSTYPGDLLFPSNCLYPNNGGTPVTTLPLATCPTGFLIPLLPAGGVLVIDSAHHTITYTDASGIIQDGSFLLAQDTARAIQWQESFACDPADAAQVLVGATSYASDATVEIDYQHREG